MNVRILQGYTPFRKLSALNNVDEVGSFCLNTLTAIAIHFRRALLPEFIWQAITTDPGTIEDDVHQ